MRGRVQSLDGLRGVAALIVMLSHCVYASSAYGSVVTVGPRILIDTPIRLLWAGHQMVIVFFVLSGYVLSLPAVTRGFGWWERSYYPRRFIRLYLPAAVAILFGFVLHEMFARRLTAGVSWWMSLSAVPVSVSTALRDATLISQRNATGITVVLWSLRWEVWFSLLLPAFLVLPILTRERPRVALLTAALCVLLIADGTQRLSDAFRFMPMFELGALLAFHRPPAAKLLLPVGLLLLTLGAIGNGDVAGEVYSALGAVLIVWWALRSELLRGRTAQWLGSRSYSLYLVHIPIVVTLAFLLGGSPNPFLLTAAAAPLALLAAELFWRFVENPAVQLGRRLRNPERAPLPRLDTSPVAGS